jgi:hypothetical protein
MGKIYEGENKLNVVQVCKKLSDEINGEQAKLISDHIIVYYGDNSSIKLSAKSAFAHAILDAYSDLPSNNEQDMLIRKLAKHLMEKYMKSQALTTEEENQAYEALIAIIWTKSR